MAWIWALFLAALLLVFLLCCFSFDLRKLWAEWRAVHAPRRLKVFLQTTPGYDGLLKNFVCHSVSVDGEVRGSIKAEEPLLKEDGSMEESAVALLLDSLTGFSLWTSGHIGYVTAELSFQMRGHAPQSGEEMFVKAWVKDPPKMPQDRRLRKFAVLAFELSRSATGEEHALIASGEQLQVSIATLRQRLSWALQLLCPPYFEYVWQAGMNTLGSYAKYSQPFEEIRSLKELAALKVSGAGGYEGQLKIRQLNVNGVGHGAATASMLCLAASEAHAEQPVLEAKFFYLSPAPMQTQLLLEAKPNKNPNQFQVKCD